MGSAEIHILTYMAVSTLLLSAVIWLCDLGRNPPAFRVIAVAGLISVAGILFAKYGAQSGLPWWIYYTVPALATVLLPPLLFRFDGRRTVLYLALAFATAPLIHIAFSKLLGWTDYMLFWKVS